MRRLSAVLFLVLICAITAAAGKRFRDDNFEKLRPSRHSGDPG